jgi:transcriptional regulator with XRE-family HTH domain
MIFSNNIKFLRKRKKLTQGEAADAMGFNRSTLSGYENEVSQPTVSALMTLSKFYNIAVDTLLKVDLTELSDLQVQRLVKGEDVFIKGSKIRVLATTVNSDNDDNIELVPEKAKAGYATGFADPEYIADLPKFQLPFLSKQKKYRSFQLNGDSMLPIPHGAWVTGEYVQDWSNLIDGQAYVIFTIEEGIVFKIIEDKIKEEGLLRCYSLNPLYEPFDLQINEVKEIWKFVNYISNEIPDPILPQDELLKTVANLKKDMERIKTRVIPEKKEGN